MRPDKSKPFSRVKRARFGCTTTGLMLFALGLSVNHAAAQSFPCGAAPYGTLNLTPNSPPTQITFVLGGFGASCCPRWSWFTGVSLTPTSSWVTLNSIQIPPPDLPPGPCCSQAFATFNFDFRGLPPGLYCPGFQETDTW